MPAEPVIRRAGIDDLPQLAPLFDAYRQFYELPSDPGLATRYLRERLRNRESVILFAADRDGRLAGFVQLYPSFCSLAAARIFVLYDLWIEPAARRRGVARALMTAARDHAMAEGAARLDLMTARTNHSAQRLYESLGWVRDDQFFTYNLRLPAAAD